MSENLDEDIIICRCEDIKLSEIRQSIADGNLSSEEIKRSCRCGMGPCQGRVCGAAAQFLSGWTPAPARHLLTPARIATLASCSNDESTP